MGRLADVIYVRRAMAGREDSYDAGEIVMGTQSTMLEMIRAGTERAICEQVVVLDVGALTSFAGAAALGLELTRTDRPFPGADPRGRPITTPSMVDFVAGRVVGGDGNVILSAQAALALDGQAPAAARAVELGSELRRHRSRPSSPTRAPSRHNETSCSRAGDGGAMPVDATSASELAWRTLGRSAVVPSHRRPISVVADQTADPGGRRGAWKASLARLLEPEGSLAHAEGARERRVRLRARWPCRCASRGRASGTSRRLDGVFAERDTGGSARAR